MLKKPREICEYEGCKGKAVMRCSNCLRYVCEKHSGDLPLLCEECSKIPESKREKETIVVLPSASPYAFITTAESCWIRKLRKHTHAELLEEHRDSKGKVHAYVFAIDKRCLTLKSKPRKRYDHF